MQRVGRDARTGLALVAVTAALSLTAGCGGSPDGANTLVIYSSNALGAGLGENTLLSDRLRAEEIALQDAHERAGRYGVRLKVVDNTDPTQKFWGEAQTRQNAQEAARDPRAVAFIDSGHSGASAVAAPILNRAGMLQVSAQSTYVGLTRRQAAAPGDPERYFPTGRRTFARVSLPDHVQAAVMIEALRRRHIRRVLVLRDASLYGTGLGTLAYRRARERHLEVVAPLGQWTPPDNGAALAGQGSRVGARAADLGAQAVVLAGYASDRFVVEVARAAPRLLVVVGDCCSSGDFAQGVREVEQQVLITGPPLPDDHNPEVRRFADEFADRFGKKPDDPGVFQAYEAMRAILEAVRRSDGTRAGTVRAFFATHDRDSVLGRYSIDRFGDPTLKKYGVYGVSNGKLVYRGPLATH